MSVLNFSNKNSGNQSLYEATNGIFWCAYLLPQETTLKDTIISFEDTHKYGGYYLFATKAPKNPNTFVINAWNYFKSKEKTNQFGGISWLFAINDTLSDDNTSLLQLQKHGSSFSILANYNFNFGHNLAALTISGLNVTISLDVKNNRFLFTSSSSFITFNANEISSDTLPHKQLEIPLTGKAMASMRFLVGFNYGQDFNAFDIALKYFFPNQTTANVEEMSYPVFKCGSSNEFIQFQASINPIDMLNQQQLSTYLAFLGSTFSNINGGTQQTVMGTFLQSDYGVPIHLIPKLDFSSSNGSNNIPSSSSAQIVFSERDAKGAKTWYVVPSGNFTLSIDPANTKYLDSNNQLRVLCGLAGTESISVSIKTSENTGDQIVFIPKQNAYIKQFPIQQLSNKVGANTAQQGLENTYMTAWVGWAKNSLSTAEIVYHSQPQGSALYSKKTINNTSRFLNYFIANSGTFSGHNNVSFPMVLYGKSIVIPRHIQPKDFELQILSPRRKVNISKALKNQALKRVALKKSNVGLADTISTTSPQGFYIEVDKNTATWNKLKLASNQFKKNNGELSSIYNLEFNNLSATLQSAFQTNQLFMVVTANVAEVLGDFKNKMKIEEWPFNIKISPPNSSVPNMGVYNNVLIFKYCDQSLQDRIKNIQYWTNPDQFNDTSNNGLSNISNWISDYIQKGIEKYTQQNDTDYYKFYKVATDPNWKGVLALKVDISLTSFPSELQGLLAGIELNEFNAHHFGVDLSIVENNDGTIEMKPTSSLFGLIDYEDQIYEQFNSNINTYKAEAPINTSVDYVYNVLLLKVLFTNSKITNFNSYIAFTINKLFEETVLSDSRSNLLILKGTYENHKGVPTYTFNATGDNLLEVNGDIIKNVEILKANFVTSASQSGKGKGQVTSRFSFFGYLNFDLSKQGPDLLSFGNEKGSTPNGKGISFSNMYIDLTFPLDTPTDQTFTFDISKMSFDIGASYARKSSLYRHFPLQLTGIVKGNKDSLPKSQGYLNVDLPASQQQVTIMGNWYGLVFKLNMGTLGALASDAGFNTTFMISWNVGGSGVVAGLKLPGVNPQAPTLSLQGVIKMDIGSIRIDIADDSKAYLMKINNIALKVLSLSFPPNAQIGFFLFGNPSETAPPESLGWYAAYKKN